MIQIVGTMAAVLGLAGGFITLENHWVSYPYHVQGEKSAKANHDSDIAQLSKEIQQIQKNSALKTAWDRSLFYNQLEASMLAEKARYGGKSPSPEFDLKLKDTIEKRKQAEETVKRMEESK